MKSCCAILALASGAYAASDVSPPVISLSLAHGDYADRNCQVHACSADKGKNVDGHESATCEVGTAAVPASDKCLLPKCKAYDHHEGSISCTSVFKMVNNDGVGIPKDDAVVAASVDKNVRSEWLLTYDAQDASGNAADSVSFTMIFQDTVKPVLTTPLGLSLAKATVRSPNDATAGGRRIAFAEACSQGGAAPCTYNVARTASSNDNYDGDVSDGIFVKLTHPAASTGGAQTWTKQNALTELSIDTRVVDTTHADTAFHWTLQYKSQDDAGIFGYGEANNEVRQAVKIYVSDNTKPVITQHAHAAGHTLECGVDTYTEMGANCHDTRDQWSTALKKYLPKAATVGGDAVDTATISADLSETKTYSVTYNCKDASGNVADTSTRNIVVQDTTDPVITLVGPKFIENSMGAHNNEANPNSYEGPNGLKLEKLTAAAGATCLDDCDKNPTITATLHYGATCGSSLVAGGVSKFPELVPGDFSIKYTCSDGNAGDTRVARTVSVCRRIFNQDYTKPVIEVLGDDDMTLEATHKGNYVDDGATCSDQVDGVISQNVEVSGDVVNLSKVGTYVITYNCQDARGNFAPTMTRSVHVKQNSCPTCSVNGNLVQHHEASFPYVDAGAKCNDLIDGPVATVIKTDKPVDVEAVGTYFITYRAVNSVGLWNDGKCMLAGKPYSNNYVRTVVIKDTLKPVIQIKYKGVQVGRSGDGPDSSLSGVTRSNPAYAEGKASGHFMAEQAASSASGWIFGAAASAVAGLALLGLSQRKAAAVSVPV